MKSLCFYDELGLLQPVEVDRFTVYRYYAVEQLPRLNRILALKDPGFSLEQISELLSQDMPLERMRGLLCLKQVEIRQRLEEEQGRMQ